MEGSDGSTVCSEHLIDTRRRGLIIDIRAASGIESSAEVRRNVKALQRTASQVCARCAACGVLWTSLFGGRLERQCLSGVLEPACARQATIYIEGWRNAEVGPLELI